MTLTDAGSTRAAERITADRAAGSPRAPRRWRAVVVTALLVGIPVAAVVGWWAVSASILAGASVGFDAEPVTCEGARVGVLPSFDDPDVLQTAVERAPGMRCTVRVHVVNDSGVEVTVESVTLPLMGPESAFGLAPLFVNPNGQYGVASEDGIDTRFATPGLPVAPGEAQLVEVLLEDGGHGHNADCSTASVQFPLVEVSVFGYRQTLRPPDHQAILWHEGSLDCTDDVIP